MLHDRDDVTQILREVTAGNDEAAGDLLAAVYHDLRAIAGAAFRGQPGNHTLQPTALVSEAYMRLVERTGVSWNDRSHFLALCSVIMRGILVDHARKRSASKRGGDWDRVTISGLQDSGTKDIDLIAIDEALSALEAVSERRARVVEYRFFGGLTVPQIADLLDVSVSTVEEDWRFARAWLVVRLQGSDG